MPMLKAINGHTGCTCIEAHLEKDGRTLMRDFFNLSWDELEDKGLDESLKDEARWAREMDALHRDCGSDAPWKGQRATQQGRNANRWQYEPKGSASRQQKAMQSDAAANGDRQERSQEG
jgi:hypothetical protein